MISGNSSRVWFYYANDQQVGPLPLSEVKKAVQDGIILEEDYVYREGFHDWKPLKEVPELLGDEPTVRSPIATPPPRLQADRSQLAPHQSSSSKSSKASAASQPNTVRSSSESKGSQPRTATPSRKASERRIQPRANIVELVVAHNDSHIATGSLTDISISGVFFKTKETCFSINDEIKVTLKEGKGLGKPLHLRGTVVRQSKENGQGMGYGLELKNLDERTRSSIIDYVKRHQAF